MKKVDVDANIESDTPPAKRQRFEESDETVLTPKSALATLLNARYLLTPVLLFTADFVLRCLRELRKEEAEKRAEESRNAAEREMRMLRAIRTSDAERELSRSTYCVYVRMLTGDTLCLPCQCSDTGEMIKWRVFMKRKILVDQQRLMCNGRQLEEWRSLADQNIQHQSTINVILRLRGGMYHQSTGLHGFAREYSLSVEVDPKNQLTLGVNNKVTLNEFMKMIVEAMQYSEEALRSLRLAMLEFDGEFVTSESPDKETLGELGVTAETSVRLVTKDAFLSAINE